VFQCRRFAIECILRFGGTTFFVSLSADGRVRFADRDTIITRPKRKRKCELSFAGCHHWPKVFLRTSMFSRTVSIFSVPNAVFASNTTNVGNGEVTDDRSYSSR